MNTRARAVWRFSVSRQAIRTTAQACSEVGGPKVKPTARNPMITSEREALVWCQDPVACNYQSAGILAGGDCEYSSCVGCADQAACNYSIDASIDDGSCDYSCYGCTDPSAFNWDPNALWLDNSCIYFLPNCSFAGSPEWEELEAGLYSDTALWHYTGVTALGEYVLSLPSVVTEPASGSTFVVESWTNLGISNTPPGLEFDSLPLALGPGEQACLSYSGIPVEEGFYQVTVTGELIVSLFGNPISAGTYSVVGSLEILPNPNSIPGCTYGNASNFSAIASEDDGSCVFAGCMEPSADNYQLLATEDDGSCEFENCTATCPGDLNGDGAVGTPDLLGLLATFGFVCE